MTDEKTDEKTDSARAAAGKITAERYAGYSLSPDLYEPIVELLIFALTRDRARIVEAVKVKEWHYRSNPNGPAVVWSDDVVRIVNGGGA